MSGETHTSETVEENETTTENSTGTENNTGTETHTDTGEENPDNDFEKDFEEFEKNKTEHKPEETDTDTGKKREFIPDDDDVDANTEFKLRIFMGLFFMLVDGLHAFIFSMILKRKVDSEEIAIDEEEQEGLEIYFQNSQKIQNLLNKLSPEVMGIIHLEWIYFQKLRELKKQKEIEDKEAEEKEEETDRENVEDLEEEEDNEMSDEEIEAQKKKKPRKRARKRKKPNTAARKKKAETQNPK